jgi:hypothetical protein
VRYETKYKNAQKTEAEDDRAQSASAKAKEVFLPLSQKILFYDFTSE